MLFAFLGQSVTNLCPFMGCLHALHFGAVFVFFGATCETTVRNVIEIASMLDYSGCICDNLTKTPFSIIKIMGFHVYK